jgi:hypothetical protein
MPRRRQPKPGEQLALDLAGVKSPRPPRVSGSTLNRWVIAHLQLRGCVAWRQNSGAATFGEGERRRFVRFGFPGLSDVIGWTPDGRFLAVEGKVLDDLSPQQQGFLDMVRRAGGIALVVKPDNFQSLIDDALGVPANERWTQREQP